MTYLSERQIRIKIEEFIFNKYKELIDDSFFIKAKNYYEDDEIVDYEAMVEDMAIKVDQYMIDEEIELEEMNMIPVLQWREWISFYNVPEKSCERCHSGCNHCLMIV